MEHESISKTMTVSLLMKELSKLPGHFEVYQDSPAYDDVDFITNVYVVSEGMVVLSGEK